MYWFVKFKISPSENDGAQKPSRHAPGLPPQRKTSYTYQQGENDLVIVRFESIYLSKWR